MDNRLSESEERFHALVTATSDVVYRMSPDWRIMRQLTGGGFVADTGEPIENWMDKYIYADDLDLVHAAIMEAIKNKSMYQLEHRVLRADGTLGWTSSKAVPIIDNSGEITEWFGAANDVTPRKTMEQDLKAAINDSEQQKRLYETVTSSTPDLIYVFGLDYTFTYANDALLKMWGKTAEDAIGKRLLENGYEPWHAEMHEREIDEVVANRKPIRGEVSFPHATLGRRVYDYILTPVINEFGVVEAVAGTTRDITDLKAEEQRKNDFISMVSHELKTPLTSVTGYLQILKNRIETQSKVAAIGILNRTEKQIKSMTRMINGFLNVARLESGKMQMDFSKFDMQKLLTEIETEIYDVGNGHKINFDVDENMTVNADYEKIGQVIQNFISNAIKYSLTGAKVSVTCKRKESKIVLSVLDEGIGLNEDDFPHLFKRFYRSSDSSIKNIAGFGIGLYLSAEIIKRHSGQIWAENRPTGGSAFYFNIPAA